MAKRATKTREEAHHDEGRIRLPSSLRKHLRRLKALGRTEEAAALRRAALDAKRRSGEH